MAQAEEHIKGLADLQKFLDTLTPKLEANVMRGAMRAGMNVVLPVARANVRSISGELAAGLTISTKIEKTGWVTASIKTKGKHGFVGTWVEYGTAAHVIAAQSGALSIGGYGVFRQVVMHPGADKKPFLRPALDGQAVAAVIAAAAYIRKRLETKFGLDTSGIILPGDE